MWGFLLLRKKVLKFPKIMSRYSWFFKVFFSQNSIFFSESARKMEIKPFRNNFWKNGSTIGQNNFWKKFFSNFFFNGVFIQWCLKIFAINSLKLNKKVFEKTALKLDTKFFGKTLLKLETKFFWKHSSKIGHKILNFADQNILLTKKIFLF